MVFPFKDYWIVYYVKTLNKCLLLIKLPQLNRYFISYYVTKLSKSISDRSTQLSTNFIYGMKSKITFNKEINMLVDEWDLLAIDGL